MSGDLRRRAVEARIAVSLGKVSVREALERLGEGLEPRDRGLLLHLVAGTTRSLLTLDHLLSRHASRRLDRMDPPVREALRIGAFQVLFCSRIPVHAAVGTAVEAAKALEPRGAGTVNAILRALSGEVLERGEDLDHCQFSVPVLPEGDPLSASLLSIRFSLPAWLLERWLARFGPAETERLARQALQPPPVTLRPRGGGDPLPSQGGDVTSQPGWAEGEFSVQDATAQAVVSEGVRPRSGERVLDLCAGVGGKATAMAEAGAKVTALDLSGSRLERLRVLAERLGLKSLEIVQGDALKPPAEWAGTFDAVLLDAPCTNSGVLRRRPEARWRLSPEDPARMAVLQKRLLEAALPCVKAGGRLVYSTCSLETEENEGVCSAFPSFPREEERLTLPSAEADGGYWCRFLGTQGLGA